MKEASKAMLRRWREDEQGIFPWKKLFVNVRGLDVGCSDDKVDLPNFQGFDSQYGHGDANTLSKYFEPESLETIHASQLVEHLHNPVAALRDWLTILKPGGHVIFSIPDFDLYEKRNFPSRFNGDHKNVFSLWRHGFPGVKPFHHLPTMLSKLEGVKILRCELITTNYDWNAPETLDQTFVYEKLVECFLEAVIKKI